MTGRAPGGPGHVVRAQSHHGRAGVCCTGRARERERERSTRGRATAPASAHGCCCAVPRAALSTSSRACRGDGRGGRGTPPPWLTPSAPCQKPRPTGMPPLPLWRDAGCRQGGVPTHAHQHSDLLARWPEADPTHRNNSYIIARPWPPPLLRCRPGSPIHTVRPIPVHLSISPSSPDAPSPRRSPLSQSTAWPLAHTVFESSVPTSPRRLAPHLTFSSLRRPRLFLLA